MNGGFFIDGLGQKEQQGGFMIKELKNDDHPFSSNEDVEVHNPHDSYFQCMMRERKVQKEFLKEYLPKTILKMMDLRTVKKMDGHFVEESMRHPYSDFLMSARLRGDGPAAMVYVLVEHQSKSDFWTPIRVWKYIFSA